MLTGGHNNRAACVCGGYECISLRKLTFWYESNDICIASVLSLKAAVCLLHPHWGHKY